MNVYGANKADSPYFSGFNGVADLQARAKQVDEDIERVKNENGGVIPAGNHGSFIQLEAQTATVELVSQNGNTYNYRVNRNGANVDTVDFSDAAKVAVTAPVTDVSENKSSAKGLTDRDIFIIFTGREPKKASSNPLGGMDMSGTEDMFDADGNFIYKNDEEFMTHFKKFYELTVFSGVPFQQQSPKDVANFFGEVGKRIDEAYAAGKCTDEQKEMLEKMLGDTAVEFSERAQRRQAFFKIAKEEFNMPIAERKALMESREKMTSEERTAERKAKINEYVEKFFKIDQDTLFNMINAVRYSNLNVLSAMMKA